MNYIKQYISMHTTVVKSLNTSLPSVASHLHNSHSIGTYSMI